MITATTDAIRGLKLSLGLSFGLAVAVATPAAAQLKPCANANGLGVSRVVEIDTTGGPGFGFEHYKAYDFLEPREVVLTFDDGPQKIHTEAVLNALSSHCTKAIFFSIGKMALGYPEILRRVAADGHTIGTHTWSHARLRKAKAPAEAIEEIEKGMSAVRRAVGGPISPFFRYPALEDSPETIKHLQERHVSMFSTDVDSFDFKHQPPERLVQTIIEKLEKKGKGILLMHDIQPVTARAIPLLLASLKERGFKIVHMKPKAELKTLPEFDAAIEQNVKGLGVAGTERPTSSVVKTVESEKPSQLGAQSNPGTPVEPAKAAAKQAQPTAPAAPAANTPAETGAAATGSPRKWFWQN